MAPDLLYFQSTRGATGGTQMKAFTLSFFTARKLSLADWSRLFLASPESPLSPSLSAAPQADDGIKFFQDEKEMENYLQSFRDRD